jgi:UDP-2,3-diacylglucosamine hydrolase
LKSDILFISDLHLAIDKPDITRRFLRFLEERAPTAKSLYILGDLFDAWIGDDDNTPPNKLIKQALKSLSHQGTSIFLLSGNRDFLIGKRFCDESNITLIQEDYAVLPLRSFSVLMTHGDLLCTDDLAYQEFRLKSRTPEWKYNVFSKPLWLRLIAARWYRFKSYYHKRGKTADIMDVNQITVEQVMTTNNCNILIHGHTHRPAFHSFNLNGLACQRLVLGDWKKDSGTAIRWDGEVFSVETF